MAQYLNLIGPDHVTLNLARNVSCEESTVSPVRD